MTGKQDKNEEITFLLICFTITVVFPLSSYLISVPFMMQLLVSIGVGLDGIPGDDVNTSACHKKKETELQLSRCRRQKMRMMPTNWSRTSKQTRKQPTSQTTGNPSHEKSTHCATQAEGFLLEEFLCSFG